MRRFAALSLLFLGILCGTGCRKKQVAPPIATDFTCEFRAVYRELAVEGTLKRRSAGSISLGFTKPETLNGLTAAWDGEAVKLSLLGLEYTLNPESVPEAALGKELLAVLDAALRNEGNTAQDGKAVLLQGICNNHEYTYRYDAESGAPLSLSVPALPLSITFSNCKIN